MLVAIMMNSQVDEANLAELDLDRDGVISIDELLHAMKVSRNLLFHRLRWPRK